MDRPGYTNMHLALGTAGRGGPTGCTLLFDHHTGYLGIAILTPDFASRGSTGATVHTLRRSACAGCATHALRRPACAGCAAHALRMRSACTGCAAHPLRRSACTGCATHTLRRSACTGATAHALRRSACTGCTPHALRRSACTGTGAGALSAAANAHQFIVGILTGITGIHGATHIRADLLMEIQPLVRFFIVDKIRTVTLPECHAPHLMICIECKEQNTGRQEGSSNSLTVIRRFHNIRTQCVHGNLTDRTGIKPGNFIMLLNNIDIAPETIGIIVDHAVIPDLFKSIHDAEQVTPGGFFAGIPKLAPLLLAVGGCMEISMPGMEILRRLNSLRIMDTLGKTQMGFHLACSFL